jgi:hypothetical protein
MANLTLDEAAYASRHTPVCDRSRAEVPKLWYAYLWGYAKIILVIAENTKKIRS